jgi:hypothetical protein
LIAEFHNELECPKCASGDVTRSHRTRRERILLFLDASLPYRCANCRHRFYVRDRRQLTEVYVLWAVAFVLVLGAVIFFSYRDKRDATQVATPVLAGSAVALFGKEAPAKPPVPAEPKNSPLPQAEPKRDDPPASVIKLGSHTKFGVKWNEVDLGLKVTQVKAGPLKAGGLRKGDLIAAVNSETATDENMMKARDGIVSGTTEKVRIIVLRDKTKLFYELQK